MTPMLARCEHAPSASASREQHRSFARLVCGTSGVARSPIRHRRYRRSPMFVLVLSYVKPIDEVDALMHEHVAWLEQHFDPGRFVVSGRRIPRTGGVIVARGDDREEIEDIAVGDPFVTGGVATCEVIHFRASQTADDFDAQP
jgi:uncharacterized protein YciI